MSLFPITAYSGAAGPRRSAGVLERLAPFCVALCLFALPLVFPLGVGRDYPNHLARVYIQATLSETPLLADNYVISWFLVPDLAMDLLAMPVMQVLSPYLAGSLFNGLMLVVLFTAVIALHRRATGSVGTVWPMLAVALLFNEAFRWGFVNFLFGCGLALWIVRFWLDSDNLRPAWRMRLFSVAQFVLFFAHLLGFMLCGYLILTLEIVRFWKAEDCSLGRRFGDFVFAMLQFAIPLAMLGYVLFGQSGVGDDSTVYGGIGAKIIALLSPTSALPSSVSTFILMAILVLFFLILRRRWASLDGRLLPLVVGMVVLVVAMPKMVLGIWGLDFRYPFVLLMLMIASLRPTPECHRSVAVAGIILAVVLGALGGAVLQFAETDRRQQEVREAFALVEPGGALLVAGAYDPDCPTCLPDWVDAFHAGSLAAIERQMFVPLLFTGTSPVAAAPSRYDLDVPYGWPVSRRALIEGRGRSLPRRGTEPDPAHSYWYGWDEHFDYLLWMRLEGNEDLYDIQGLEPLAAGEVFILYRIVKPYEQRQP